MSNHQWRSFYHAIKDPSWPACDSIEDIFLLPQHVQFEIINDYLFSNRFERVTHELQHVDTNFLNFLWHTESIKSMIGSEFCLMNHQDVIFVYSLLISKRPQLVLEIGRFAGWSTSVIYGAFCDNNIGHLYSIDLKDQVSAEIKTLVGHRTTFISCSSEYLSSISELQDKKFDVIFIDGDHSYQMVLNDLYQSYELSSDEAWFLLHDADNVEILQAVDTFLDSVTGIVDCGVYGETIKLLYKREKK